MSATQAQAVTMYYFQVDYIPPKMCATTWECLDNCSSTKDEDGGSYNK